MNALATDQAKRLAEMIYADNRLRDKVTSGLFIGKGKDKDKKDFRQVMQPDGIIENSATRRYRSRCALQEMSIFGVLLHKP